MDEPGGKWSKPPSFCDGAAGLVSTADYLLAFARPPRTEEMTLLLQYLEVPGRGARQAYEDILWALLNADEFLFNH